jgi:UDP-N-acetylglucosamine transferase subunit ALG13
MDRRYRVLLVSSSGGVLLDLLALRPWWQRHDPVWVAVRADDTEVALAGQRVHWQPELSASTRLKVLPAAWRALRLLRAERPDVIVSAGTGVAVGFFLAARLLRVPAPAGQPPPRRARRRALLMARILVTVGMGPWPFDRLIGALAPVCAAHEVFAQTGTSTVEPPCEHAPFVALDDLQARLARADIVITHAGNTVRLVQRLGGVPIAVAREHARGEMGNDHQVSYLRDEERTGRVVAVWDVTRLPEAVSGHAEARARLMERPVPRAVGGDELARVLDDLCGRLVR